MIKYELYLFIQGADADKWIDMHATYGGHTLIKSLYDCELLDGPMLDSQGNKQIETLKDAELGSIAQPFLICINRDARYISAGRIIGE